MICPGDKEDDENIVPVNHIHICIPLKYSPNLRDNIKCQAWLQVSNPSPAQSQIN